MNALTSLASGIAGATALTLLYESARKTIPAAPHVDRIGKRAIAAAYRAADRLPPSDTQLHRRALAGELLSNSFYYALVTLGDPKHAVRRGGCLGLFAGLGAVALPPLMGLGRRPVQRTPATAAMTIAWYTLGGLAAGAVHSVLSQE